jgi:hypothetical protein
MGTDGEATEGDLDVDALLEELTNWAREHCGNLAKERDSSILEVQHMGTDGETTENLDDDVLLEELTKWV